MAIPMRPPTRGQHERFGEELEKDVAVVCADGFAQADFSCAFGYGDEHDVHNADAADQEADGADAGEEGGQGGGDRVGGFEQPSLVVDGEVVGLVCGEGTAQAQGLFDLSGGGSRWRSMLTALTWMAGRRCNHRDGGGR